MLEGAISRGDVQEVARILAQPGVSVEDIIGHPETRPRAIHLAISHPTVLTALLEVHGANVNSRRADGSTALCDAAMEGHAEAVKILCEHGADVNATDDDGDGPLCYAQVYRLLHGSPYAYW